MSRSLLVRAVFYSTTLLGVALTAPAFGDDDTVQEVVVTAQRRAELSRDVPISISSLSADTLEQSGVAQLGDIAKLTPALRFDASGSFFQPTIRGVGTAVATSGWRTQCRHLCRWLLLLQLRSLGLPAHEGAEHPGSQGTAGDALRPAIPPAARYWLRQPIPAPSRAPSFKASYGSYQFREAAGIRNFRPDRQDRMDVEGIYSPRYNFVRNIITHDDNEGKYEKLVGPDRGEGGSDRLGVRAVALYALQYGRSQLSVDQRVCR